MNPYFVEKIFPTTWKITEGLGKEAVNMYLLEGENRCMLLDTGYGEIPLTSIIRSLSRKPLIVVLSHSHFDHIGGVRFFSEAYISKDELETFKINSAILKYQEDLARVSIKNLEIFSGELVPIDLGNRKISIIPVPGHTPGSICCFDSESHNIFTADTCCKGDVLLCMKTSTPLGTYSDSINRLISIEPHINKRWPAHHDAPLNTMIFHEYREALDVMLSGKAKLEKTVCFGRKALRFKYRDIGIVINNEEQ